MPAIVEEVLEFYQGQHLLAATNAAYAALRANPVASAEFNHERAESDSTLKDRLDNLS